MPWIKRIRQTTHLGNQWFIEKEERDCYIKGNPAKEFAVRTKIKYASCMDPLLEGDRPKDGELLELCCKDTHEAITNFREMSSDTIDQHL